MNQQVARRNNSNKETLARLMAREGVTVVYDNSQQTASFNTFSRVLTLPVMIGAAEYVFDWFIAHEVSHALYTPSDDNFFKKITDKVLAGYFNVTEDARIEKLIKLKYPGTKKDCRKFYEHFADPTVDFFEIKDKNIDEMKLIDRINLYFKIGHLVDIKFTDEEQEYVDLVDYAITAEDALDAAKKILDRETKNQQDQDSDEDNQQKPKKKKVKIKMPGKAPKSSGGGQDDSDGDIEVEVEYEEPSDDSDGESQEDSPEDDQQSSGNSKGSGSEDDGDDSGDTSEDSGDDEDTITIDLRSPETQDAFNEAMKDMFGQNPQTNIINTDSNMKSVHTIIEQMQTRTKNLLLQTSSLKRFDKYNALMLSGKPIINNLVTQFNMKKKASEYQKIKQSKTGVIDVSKLSEYLYNDDIFLRNDIVMEAKNHGLFFLLDWSGSMSSIIKDTFKQLILLIEFCRLSGIPYEVYGFTSGNQRVLPDSISAKNMLATTEGVDLIRILDSSMNKRTHMQVCEHVLIGNTVMGMVSTPICGSIVVSETLIKRFQAKHRCEKTVFCILSDGSTSDTCQSSGHSNHNAATIIDKSRNRYNITDNSDAWKALTLRMKDSCNLHSTIGFYLCGDSSIFSNGIANSFLRGSSKLQGYNQIFSKNGCLEVDEVMGYNKYFFITTKLLKKYLDNTATDEMKNLSTVADDKEITKAFAENLANKSLKNLAFLKIFIEQIS